MSCQLVEALVDLLEKTKRQHMKTYGTMINVRDTVKAVPMSQEDRADIAFLCRTITTHLDDLRKECEGVTQLVTDVTCAIWAKGSETARSIRGEYTLATPNVKMGVTLPSEKREPEAYKVLLAHFGMDPNSPGATCGAMRPHWPGMRDYISKLAEEGKPLPPGIDPNNQFPQYTLTHRAQKPIGE